MSGRIELPSPARHIVARHEELFEGRGVTFEAPDTDVPEAANHRVERLRLDPAPDVFAQYLEVVDPGHIVEPRGEIDELGCDRRPREMLEAIERARFDDPAAMD